MKGMFRIIVSIAISVFILALLKWIFKIDVYWVAVVVSLLIPSFVYWIFFEPSTTVGTKTIKSEKIVDSQTNKVTDEDFVSSKFRGYSYSFTIGEDKTYSTSSGQVLITRIVSQLTEETCLSPVFPWVVYTLLSAVFIFILWCLIVHDGVFVERFQQLIDQFHLPEL